MGNMFSHEYENTIFKTNTMDYAKYFLISAIVSGGIGFFVHSAYKSYSQFYSIILNTPEYRIKDATPGTYVKLKGVCVPALTPVYTPSGNICLSYRSKHYRVVEVRDVTTEKDAEPIHFPSGLGQSFQRSNTFMRQKETFKEEKEDISFPESKSAIVELQDDTGAKLEIRDYATAKYFKYPHVNVTEVKAINNRTSPLRRIKTEIKEEYYLAENDPLLIYGLVQLDEYGLPFVGPSSSSTSEFITVEEQNKYPFVVSTASEKVLLNTLDYSAEIFWYLALGLYAITGCLAWKAYRYYKISVFRPEIKFKEDVIQPDDEIMAKVERYYY